MKLKLAIFYLFCLVVSITSAQIKNPGNLPFTWKTDLFKHSVPLSEIQIALPKGSFQTLDFSEFVGKNIGLQMFIKNEPVIVVVINGLAKAYSLNMLTLHEIANDELGGKQILITYCPLCNSGVVYDRTVHVENEELVLEFEPSGMLRNSDMVMLDRKTETLWQQLTGTAIVGFFNEMELDIIPSITITVENFFDRYPDGKILSKRTGNINIESRYGYNPYRSYDSENTPYFYFFDPKKIDERLPSMERVISIENDDEFKIYSFSIVRDNGVINDLFKDRKLVLFYKPGAVSVLDKSEIANSKDVGSVTIFNAVLNNRQLTFIGKQDFFMDEQTNSSWDITGYCFKGVLLGSQLQIEPHGVHFAFAWLAFHPESEIYKK